jgi:hypothetical protein
MLPGAERLTAEAMERLLGYAGGAPINIIGVAEGIDRDDHPSWMRRRLG